MEWEKGKRGKGEGVSGKRGEGGGEWRGNLQILNYLIDFTHKIELVVN